MTQPNDTTDNLKEDVAHPGRLVSQAAEDYVKAIYKLQHESQRVSTNDIARVMNTSPAAVTKMSKHLAARNLLTHTPYYGVRLTPIGEKIALETIRHHRLLELYLFQALGYGWDEVDAEAERLEHHISEEFEERIDRMLGRPTTDPHGDPIPTRDGVIAPHTGLRLDRVLPGVTLTVCRVSDSSPEALRDLGRLGIRLGTRIEVLLPLPDGPKPLSVRIDGVEQALDGALAARVFAESTHPPPPSLASEGEGEL